MIAHITVLQDRLASANKTGEVANAEEMHRQPDASLRACVWHQKYLDTSKKEQR
jgi:hypothetical protein